MTHPHTNTRSTTPLPDAEALVEKLAAREREYQDWNPQRADGLREAQYVVCQHASQAAKVPVADQVVQKPKKCDPGPCDFQPGIPLMYCKNCEEFY